MSARGKRHYVDMRTVTSITPNQGFQIQEFPSYAAILSNVQKDLKQLTDTFDAAGVNKVSIESGQAAINTVSSLIQISVNPFFPKAGIHPYKQTLKHSEFACC